jgi:hypothetical protein
MDEPPRAEAEATGGFVPDVTYWDAWRPEEIARRLAGVTAPWYVAAGWSIDLFLGRETRAHDDLEVAVPHTQFAEVAAALPELELFVIGDGMAWPLATAGIEFENEHQTWCREPQTGLWRLDIFREPSAGGQWACRRDERIRLPYDRVIARTVSGIPYCRPEISLLFKAKARRLKDDADFANILPHLDDDSRRWLADTLNTVHPDHPWLIALT